MELIFGRGGGAEGTEKEASVLSSLGIEKVLKGESSGWISIPALKNNILWDHDSILDSYLMPNSINRCSHITKNQLITALSSLVDDESDLCY